MSNPNPSMITFTAATGGSVTFTPTPFAPGTFALPAYDASNLDLMLVSNSGSAITLSFAGGGAIIPPYSTMLLTANAATLASNTNPLAQSMAASGASATSCTATQGTNAGSLTIQRGTAVAKPVF
jgi:hypothetical protein